MMTRKDVRARSRLVDSGTGEAAPYRFRFEYCREWESKLKRHKFNGEQAMPVTTVFMSASGVSLTQGQSGTKRCRCGLFGGDLLARKRSISPQCSNLRRSRTWGGVTTKRIAPAHQNGHEKEFCRGGLVPGLCHRPTDFGRMGAPNFRRC